MRERHQSAGRAGRPLREWCTCSRPWPCDTVRALDALEAAEQRIRELQAEYEKANGGPSDYWIMRAESAEARVAVLEGALRECGECLWDAAHSDYGATGYQTFEYWKQVAERAQAAGPQSGAEEQ